MKKISLLVIIFSVIVSGAGLWQVYAQSETMTEAHIARIRANCVDAQTTLNQLHTSDALLRVNRGRIYESLATKLMVPMNSRIAANQLDGKSLVDIYTTYEKHLAEFRSTYQRYEEAMSDTLRINCVNQPVSFYDKVNETHTKRQKVHATIIALHKSINDYEKAFNTIANKFEKETQ